MGNEIRFIKVRQLIESKATSLNQLASSFNKLEFKPGSLNLDYGGGRFDKASEKLASLGAANAVYDPFNRSELHNLMARLAVARNGGADSCTVNNVLNVIAEPEALEQAANSLKEGALAHFLIYEGDGSGKGAETSKGWQRNAKAAEYLPALSKIFGTASRKGNLITCGEPAKSSDSLYSIENIQSELMALAKKSGVPMPSSKLGFGKAIGGCLYVHKSSWGRLEHPGFESMLATAKKHLEPDVAKIDLKSGECSFIEAPGFDHEDEPSIGRSLKVAKDGSFKIQKAKQDPQIYHHKWNFCHPDDAGFDYCESIARSIAWAQIPCDRSRIGTLSHWRAHVLEKSLDASWSKLPRAPKPLFKGRPAARAQ